MIFSGSSNTDSRIRLLNEWQNNPLDVPGAKHQGKHFYATYLFFKLNHTTLLLSFIASLLQFHPFCPEIQKSVLFFFFYKTSFVRFFLQVMTYLSRAFSHCFIGYMKLQSQYAYRKTPSKALSISDKLIFFNIEKMKWVLRMH